MQYNARPSNGSLIAIRISQFYLETAESLLEKEKEVMKKMFIEGDWTDYYLGIEDESFEYLYNETFKDIPLK